MQRQRNQQLSQLLGYSLFDKSEGGKQLGRVRIVRFKLGDIFVDTVDQLSWRLAGRQLGQNNPHRQRMPIEQINQFFPLFIISINLLPKILNNLLAIFPSFFAM